jgi:lipopolysaccharide export system permease protein
MVIWRYLFTQFFKSILSVLFFSMALFFILTYMEESQHYFSNYHPSQKTILFYYFWQLPSILVQLLPFAVLIGALITNWILAKNGEIAAMRAAGLSVLKISVPLICVGLFFSLFQFYVDECVIPVSSSEFLKVKVNEIEKKDRDNIFSKSKWLKKDFSTLHYAKYNEYKQILEYPELFSVDINSRVTDVIQAKSAYFNSQLGFWIFEKVVQTHFNENGIVSSVDVMPQYQSIIDFVPPSVLKQNSDSSQLSFWALKKLIDEAQLAGSNVSDRIVDLYMKVSMPFANLLFIFLTIPFALRKERQEENYIGIIFCLAVALIYWFGNLSFRNMGVKGIINPFLAAWFMNICVGMLVIILIRKLDRGQ